MENVKIKSAEIYSKILEVSENSYYRWKSKDHTVLMNLLEKYFSENDLQEFLETGKIQKQERLNELIEIEKKYNQITKIIGWEIKYEY